MPLTKRAIVTKRSMLSTHSNLNYLNISFILFLLIGKTTNYSEVGLNTSLFENIPQTFVINTNATIIAGRTEVISFKIFSLSAMKNARASTISRIGARRQLHNFMLVR